LRLQSGRIHYQRHRGPDLQLKKPSGFLGATRREFFSKEAKTRQASSKVSLVEAMPQTVRITALAYMNQYSGCCTMQGTTI
jgi:hypothetical protein